jgi:arsenite methyltransferase
MAGMSFDDATAERLEAAYLGPDVTAQRAETLRRLALEPGERVLDIGSGPGFLCLDMAEAVGPSGRVRGIDVSPDMITRVSARNPHPWLSYAEGDATALPEPDRAYDVVVSTQVAEYVADISRFCLEAYRVLAPGGRGLVLATDWDTVAWHSADPARMARVLEAWRAHCADSRLPRTLAPRLRAAGFTVTAVSVFPIVNLDWDEGCYSQGLAPLIGDFVRSRAALADAEIEAWEAELEELASTGRYFFASSRFLFGVTRPTSP